MERGCDMTKAKTNSELKKENEWLRRGLRAIISYPKKGEPRRTKDGYPEEIVCDEFAYKRMVDSYRAAARAALAGEASSKGTGM